MTSTCPSCGARLTEGAEQCILCGSPIEQSGGETKPAAIPTPTDAAASAASGVSAVAPAAAAAGSAGDVVFCNQCGWQNPSGSRFCSQCGAGLQAVGETPTASGGAPSAAPDGAAAAAGTAAATGSVIGASADTGESGKDDSVGRRLGMIFGAAILVVVAIFLINAMTSGDDSPPTSTMAPAGPISTSAELPDDVARQVESIRSEAQGLQGEERISRLRAVVETLLGVGRFDRAAAEQEAIAQETGLEEDWTRAGNFYYDWMDQQFGQERATFAQQAIAAYQKALELNPDNLDVRTDMAVAYMSDPENPMLAMQENAAVLAADSLHVQANFNRGIMLLQINRVDGALAQFRKVQRIVGDPEDQLYRLAEQAILSVSQGAAAPSN